MWDPKGREEGGEKEEKERKRKKKERKKKEKGKKFQKFFSSVAGSSQPLSCHRGYCSIAAEAFAHSPV
jgi:hypothetical protein